MSKDFSTEYLCHQKAKSFMFWVPLGPDTVIDDYMPKFPLIHEARSGIKRLTYGEPIPRHYQTMFPFALVDLMTPNRPAPSRNMSPCLRKTQQTYARLLFSLLTKFGARMRPLTNLSRYSLAIYENSADLTDPWVWARSPQSWYVCQKF